MIGMFDSGYGGLTILRALTEQLPQYTYIYLGDNANAPYGNKSTVEIIEKTRAGVDLLFSRGAQLVILGCNTASAAALRDLQQTWLPRTYPTRHLLGILVPTVEQITGADWRHTQPITTPVSSGVFSVGVLATPATVATQAYPREIHKRNASIRVTQVACQGLADAIEQNDGERAASLTKKYVQQLKELAPGLRAVLLGCTHFELISADITALLPPHVRVYHQPNITAMSLANYLEKHPALLTALDIAGDRQFFTSGNPGDVAEYSARYLGETMKLTSSRPAFMFLRVPVA